MRQAFWPTAVVLAIALFATPSASADITVTGTIYYLDMTELSPVGVPGVFKPAANTRIALEYEHWWIPDEEGWTDENGKYTFKIINPLVGCYNVKLEVRAQVRLSRDGEKDVTISAWDGHLAMYPLNGDTRVFDLYDDQTRTMNIYIAPRCGDRRNDITSWDYEDDGSKTLVGLFAVQKAREAFNWFTARAATKSQLSRNTNILCGEDKTCYEPYPYIYYVQWGNEARINLGSQTQMFPDDWLDSGTDIVPGRWRSLRGSITHEYGHKIMHDVYWAWPEPYVGSGHSIETCANSETGWVEGWAAFCCAAVWGQPTNNGSIGAGQANLEHVWHPTTRPWSDGDRLPGTIDWRDRLDKPSLRGWNEGEVASVLLDLFDGKAWEYLPKAQQDARPAGVPPVRWYDRIEDPKLELIWKIINENNPDCLIDDGDSFPAWEDGFWYYWRTRFCGDGDFWGNQGQSNAERSHGTKAILHNRGITTTYRPENAPKDLDLKYVASTGAQAFATLSVTETDDEDRPFLYYNVAFGSGTGELKWMFPEDQLLTSQWNNDRLTQTVAIPPPPENADAPGAWTRMVLVVHDSMQCAYLQKTPSDLTGTGGTRTVRLVASGGSSFLLRPDGKLMGWGRNYSGELGNGRRSIPNTGERVPVAVGGFDDLLRFASRFDNSRSMAVRRDGTVWIWGHGFLGGEIFGPPQIAPDNPRYLKSLAMAVPVQYKPLANVRSIALGHNINLAALADGTVWGWIVGGKGEANLLGYPRQIRLDIGVPVKVPGLADVVEVAAGSTHGLVLTRNGQVWAFGYNGFGETGRPFITGQESDPAAKAVPGLDHVTAIAAHANHCLALKRDGTVWAWGRNNFSQLGDGTTTHRDVPVQVQGLSSAVAIAVGTECSIALLADGIIMQWGAVYHTELNKKGVIIGRYTLMKKPVPVLGLDSVIAIAAGSIHFLALKSDGTVWGWGYNLFGRLPGEKHDEMVYIPRQVLSLNAFDAR